MSVGLALDGQLSVDELAEACRGQVPHESGRPSRATVAKQLPSVAAIPSFQQELGTPITLSPSNIICIPDTLTGLLNNVSSTPLPSDGPVMSLFADVKALSAGQNLQTFQKKAFSSIQMIRTRALELRQLGLIDEAHRLEIQAMTMQTAILEWKIAAGSMGHRQLVDLYESSQTPSVFGGVNLFTLAMSLSAAGQGHVLGGMLGGTVTGKRGRSDTNQTDQPGQSGVSYPDVSCHNCKRKGHYKNDCPKHPENRK